MKKIITLIILAFTVINSNAQGVWTQKASIGGLGREGSSSFSIGSKGYVVCGVSPGPTYYSDLWEFDQASNTWTQKANFPGTPRSMAAAFSIGTKGYFGTGNKCCPTNTNYNDFWEWNQGTNTWTQKAYVPYNPWGAVGMSIGNKGYIGLGVGANHYSNFYEYDPIADTWTTKASFGGGARREAVAFSIGSKGYMGTGCDYQSSYRDFWEFDPVTNSWVQKADVGPTPRFAAVGFSVGNNGYIGVGGNNLQDFWEFNQANNTWTQMANFGGTGRGRAIGFSIGSKGYIGTGSDANGQKNDLWEWGSCLVAPSQPGAISGLSTICENTTNTYSVTAVAGATSYTWSLPNGWSGSSVTTSINATAGVSGGTITVVANNACGSSTAQTLAVTVNNAPVQPQNISGPASVCDGSTYQYSIPAVAGATGYTWTLPNGWNGTSVTNNINATAVANNGQLTVTVTNSCGTSQAQTLSVTVNPIYSTSATASICQGDSILLGGTYQKTAGTYTDLLQTINGCDSTVMTTLTINPLPTVTMAGMNALCADNPAISLTNGLPTGGTYSGPGVSNAMFNPAVAGAGTHTITYSYTDPNTGCSNSTSKTITVNPLPAVPTISTNGSTFTSSAATGNQWYLNGNAVNGATNQTFTCTGNGNYTVCVTDANGCKSCSAVLNFTTFSISENQSAHDIAVYPNPFSGELTITAGGRTGTVAIYNTLGEKIYSSQVTDQPLTINLGEVPRGMYFLEFTGTGGTVLKRLVKE